MEEETPEFKSEGRWEKWLSRNHATSKDLWIRFFRKDSGVESVGVTEANDVALCYGWISGQAKPLDEKSWLGRFVPRRPRSIWSKINTERAKRLVKEGRMRPAGQKQIDEAKRDGRWDHAYSPPSTAKIPKDFIKELRKNKRAEAFFRRAKIRKVIEMFEGGEKFH